MGLSQVEFGESIGVTGAMVSMYESGQRVPAMDTLTKISRVLRVSLDDLMKEDDVVQDVVDINPMRNSKDFGFMISRSKKYQNGGDVMLVFDNGRPVLKINGVVGDFARDYSQLLPEDKIIVCKEMLRRAKEEFMSE